MAGPLFKMTDVLIRRGEREIKAQTCTEGRHREKNDNCKPSRQTLEETSPASTWISDF